MAWYNFATNAKALLKFGGKAAEETATHGGPRLAETGGDDAARGLNAWFHGQSGGGAKFPESSTGFTPATPKGPVVTGENAARPAAAEGGTQGSNSWFTEGPRPSTPVAEEAGRSSYTVSEAVRRDAIARGSGLKDVVHGRRAANMGLSDDTRNLMAQRSEGALLKKTHGNSVVEQIPDAPPSTEVAPEAAEEVVKKTAKKGGVLLPAAVVGGGAVGGGMAGIGSGGGQPSGGPSGPTLNGVPGPLGGT